MRLGSVVLLLLKQVLLRKTPEQERQPIFSIEPSGLSIALLRSAHNNHLRNHTLSLPAYMATSERVEEDPDTATVQTTYQMSGLEKRTSVPLFDGVCQFLFLRYPCHTAVS
jgi:hypothetical protein